MDSSELYIVQSSRVSHVQLPMSSPSAPRKGRRRDDLYAVTKQAPAFELHRRRHDDETKPIDRRSGDANANGKGKGRSTRLRGTHSVLACIDPTKLASEVAVLASGTATNWLIADRGWGAGTNTPAGQFLHCPQNTWEEKSQQARE